jgi:hypothetical protein
MVRKKKAHVHKRMLQKKNYAVPCLALSDLSKTKKFPEFFFFLIKKKKKKTKKFPGTLVARIKRLPPLI